MPFAQIVIGNTNLSQARLEYAGESPDKHDGKNASGHNAAGDIDCRNSVAGVIQWQNVSFPSGRNPFSKSVNASL
jgi:hypothetical protein